MKKLWISYAWADNKDGDFDYLVQEIGKKGIEVEIDKKVIVAGQPLWDRIFGALEDSSLDAWALYLTASSLRSEACKEELASALDRALKKGRHNFPLIGIFPGDVSRELIPSPIRTRKYVHLSNPNALDEIVAGVNGEISVTKEKDILPLNFRFRNDLGYYEFWPRIGSLSDPFVLIQKKQFELSAQVTPYPESLYLVIGARGGRPGGVSMNMRTLQVTSIDGQSLNGTQVGGIVSYGASAFFQIPESVTEVYVGGLDGNGSEVACKFFLNSSPL